MALTAYVAVGHVAQAVGDETMKNFLEPIMSSIKLGLQSQGQG
jgi:hypothetical protein